MTMWVAVHPTVKLMRKAKVVLQFQSMFNKPNLVISSLTQTGQFSGKIGIKRGDKSINSNKGAIHAR